MSNVSSPPDITFKTPRLMLRPPNFEDAAGIFRNYAQDDDVTRFLVWQSHETERQTEAFVKYCIDRWASGQEFTWTITLVGSDEPIGMVREGVLRRWIVHPNISSEPRDSLVFAKVRPQMSF